MAEKLSEWIWHNGEFIPWEDATVHISAHAIHYGSSVFEGIRAYDTPDGPAIFRLEPHVKRMFYSAKVARLDLGITPEQMSQAIVDLVKKNGHDACYIRPVSFRGVKKIGVDGRQCPVENYIFTMEWGAYLGEEAIMHGVDVMVSSWRRMAPNTVAPGAKIGGQYVSSQFIAMEAHELGYSEGIALDVNGYVSEGSGENIFLVIDGKIYTPPLAASILNGITRESALTLARDAGYEVEETFITREMLYLADEVFFTGTAAEITPVKMIDRLPVGAGTRGPVTETLQIQFFGITSGELPDKYGWLTHVDK